MSVPPESILVGKCYLADHRQNPQVRQVVTIFPDGRVEYRSRPVQPKMKHPWRSAMTVLVLFAAIAEREVPCDWRPESDEQKP